MNEQGVVARAMGSWEAHSLQRCRRGVRVVPLDIRAPGEAHGNVRDVERVRRVLRNADGIVHLSEEVPQ